ncbi:hypothetical protein [Xanthomonas sp. MUS 060]|uniref:hypothetical protein n=1 Tax=Xanthomonas sp. MUS 060 TaxID=1588031 RepID=UPI0005F2D572|nr:hypothetical protein [Xanthomonas sp. MUS 060]
MNIRSYAFSRVSLRMSLWLALPLFVAASPSLSASTPAITANALPAGEWRGSLALDSQRLVAVRLTQQGGKSLLNFGSPLNCALQVQPREAGSFTLNSINGGAYCDKMMGKRLTVQRIGDDLRLSIDGQSLPVVLHADPGQPSPLQGQWYGSLQPENGRDSVQVQMTVNAIAQAPGVPTVVLRYREPRLCMLQARYAGTGEGRWLYSLDPSDAGYCRRLSDGTLELRKAPDGQVLLQLYDRAGAPVEMGKLEHASSTD